MSIVLDTGHACFIFVDPRASTATIASDSNRRTAMTIKTLAAAVALTILPATVFAYECNVSKQKQAAMSCAEGTVFDEATQACVPTTG